jgi:hypothetical protein
MQSYRRLSNISDTASRKKVTMRLPTSLLKDLKHYAIDHDIRVTDIIIVACYEFLNKQHTNSKINK